MNDHDFLCHHGIKGQKWGVRRYQNYDGSLTPAGKRRYQIKDYSITKSAANQYVSAKKRKDVARYRQKEFIEPIAKELGVMPGNGMPVRSAVDDLDYTIKKGDTIQTVTVKSPKQIAEEVSEYKQSGKNYRLFVSANEDDNRLYSGYFAASMYLRTHGDIPINELKIKVQKDIKAPSHTNQVMAFTEFYDKNKETVASALGEVYSNFEGGSPDDWKNTVLEEFTKANLQKDAYRTFIEGYGAPSKGFSENYYTVYEKFGDFLMSKGYNALLDENDIHGSYMQTSKPLILLDTLNTVGNVSLKELKLQDIYNNMTTNYGIPGNKWSTRKPKSKPTGKGDEK